MTVDIRLPEKVNTKSGERGLIAWNPRLTDAVLRAHEQGKLLKTIACDLGISPQALSRALMRRRHWRDEAELIKAIERET